jgi:phytol kinase
LLTTFYASPWRDAIASAVAAVGGVVWVRAFDLLASNGTLDQKLSRKLVHMTAGPLFLVLWPLYSSNPNAKLFAMVVPALNAARLLLVGTGVVQDPGLVKSVSREGDRREVLRGPLYYVLVLLSVTFFYWRSHPAGFIAMALMCGGDGLADIVGRRLGHARLPWNRNKSWAGSAAMFVGGFAMSMAFISMYTQLGFFSCGSYNDMAVAAACICLVATAVESLPINQWCDDNLSVPGTSALMSWLLLRTTLPGL